MDERIMDLVSLIADQVQKKQDLFKDEGRIMETLVSSGYRFHEADAALSFVQSLTETTAEDAVEQRLFPSSGVRSMSNYERNRFTLEAFSFITKLAQLGIISASQREDVIEKALALRSGRIEASEVKSLVALSLFDGNEEFEDLRSAGSDRAGGIWN